MRCAGCGRTLTEGNAVCLHCGTPVTPGSQAKTVEVALLPEPVPLSGGENWAPSYGTPASPYGATNVLTPPPPPTSASSLFDNLPPYPNSKVLPQRRMPMRAMLLAGLVALIALAVSFGLISRVHANPHAASGGELSGSSSSLPVSARCVLPALDPAAAGNVMNPQLTSGLRDVAHKDFRPVNNTVLFNVGQTIYVTFTVASNAAANLTADWCWGAAGNTSHYQLAVNHSQNVNGYFNLRNLDAAAVGTGVMVLRWNDAVIYETFFQVK
ncbi:MAG: hypothetical protein H0X24_16315 [Ktedonobacterales bacterium]|nr:hypothetical protein [Ktedonobacterales bacterium]